MTVRNALENIEEVLGVLVSEYLKPIDYLVIC